jgi:transcription elongation factor GreA-like protein
VESKERWEHWINRVIQKKSLKHLMPVIPFENPKLEIKVYTKIFEHLLEIGDYSALNRALKTFPEYLINQEQLIESLQKKIESNNDLANNEIILETLFELNNLNKNYKTCFDILVKMKD